VMNKPSLDKYESTLKPGGTLFINSSLIDKKATRDDVTVHYIPVNDIAVEVGNPRVANIVMLGAYIASSGAVSKESVIKAVEYVLGKGKAHLIPINEKAFDEGAKHI
jgi:2-oxoglutarate ferredoxin oxidoreductase subunit gamma